MRDRRAAALSMGLLPLAAVLLATLGGPAASAAVAAPLELMIAPDSFVAELLPLKAWREQQGLRVDIVTTTFIQLQYPASDMGESINDYLGARYASDQSLRYVLLAADDPLIAGRVIQVANRTDGPSTPTADRALTSDFYYSVAGNSWEDPSDRGDEYPIGPKWYGINDANWTLSPTLSVGRFPVATVAELRAYVARLLAWEQSPPSGPWQSRVLMGLGVASVPDASFSTRRLGDDAAVAFASFESQVAGAGLTNVSLRDYPAWPSAYDPLDDRLDAPTFIGEWNAGTSLAVLAARDGPIPGAAGDAYAGDGSSSVFVPVAQPSAIQALTNGARLPVFIAAYGGSANFSLDNDSNIERALSAPGGGAALAFGFSGRTGSGTQPGGVVGGWTAAAALAFEIASGGGRAGDLLDRARVRFVDGARLALGAAFDANNSSLRRAVAGLTLLGDPGALISMGPLKALDVTLPTGVPPNASSTVAVSVLSAGNPVGNATVAILDDTGELAASCLTNPAGQASCAVITGGRANWTVHVSAAGYAMSTRVLPVDSPPAIAIITPSEGSSVAGVVNFTGAAGDSDPGDSVARVEVSMNGGPWVAALGTNAWSYQVDSGQLANGPNTFSARASDGVVWSVPRTVNVNATNPRTPLLIALYPDLILNEDTRVTFALDLTSHFAPTGPGGTFNATASTADRIVLTLDRENGTLTVDPAPDFSGNAQIDLLVTESYGGSRLVPIFVRVLAVDDPPQLTVATSLTVEENNTVTFDPRALDPDGTTPLVYLQSAPQGATITGWTAPRGSEGVFQFVFAATDGRYIALAFSNVTVVSHNSAPTAAVVATREGEAGRELAFEAQHIEDRDGDPVTITWDFGDGQAASGASVTHVYAAPGSYALTLIVSDGRDETRLTEVIGIAPYQPPAEPANPAVGAIVFGSVAIIAVCAILAAYLLFFAGPRGEAPASTKKTRKGKGSSEEE